MTTTTTRSTSLFPPYLSSRTAAIPITTRVCLFLMVVINLNLATSVDATFCFTDCYRTKGCFLKPYGCTPYVNCTYAFSYQSDGEWAYLELLGQTNAERNNFVAAAFSRDQQMGDDSVVECSSFNNGPLLGRASYNQGKTNIRLNLEESRSNSFIRTLAIDYVNGMLYCQIARRIQTPTGVNPAQVFPLNNQYYVLMSASTTTSDSTGNGVLQVHDLNQNSPLYPMVSQNTITVNQYRVPQGSIMPPTAGNPQYDANQGGQGQMNPSNQQGQTPYGVPFVGYLPGNQGANNQGGQYGQSPAPGGQYQPNPSNQNPNYGQGYTGPGQQVTQGYSPYVVPGLIPGNQQGQQSPYMQPTTAAPFQQNPSSPGNNQYQGQGQTPVYGGPGSTQPLYNQGPNGQQTQPGQYQGSSTAIPPYAFDQSGQGAQGYPPNGVNPNQSPSQSGPNNYQGQPQGFSGSGNAPNNGNPNQSGQTSYQGQPESFSGPGNAPSNQNAPDYGQNPQGGNQGSSGGGFIYPAGAGSTQYPGSSPYPQTGPGQNNQGQGGVTSYPGGQGSSPYNQQQQNQPNYAPNNQNPNQGQGTTPFPGQGSQAGYPGGQGQYQGQTPNPQQQQQSTAQSQGGVGFVPVPVGGGSQQTTPAPFYQSTFNPNNQQNPNQQQPQQNQGQQQVPSNQGGTSNNGPLRDQFSSQAIIPGADNSIEPQLLKAHGILMTLSWMIFVSTAILFARFYRGFWPNTTLCGLFLWFHFHRTLNLIAIAAMIAGFVCIFVARDWHWMGPKTTNSTEQNQAWPSIHSILGLLACLVAWAQPLNAVFRCHPKGTCRPIYNIFHAFFGYGAWLMGAAALMIACTHFDFMFTNRDAAFGLCIAFICTTGAVFILLELMGIVHWFRNRRATGDIEVIQPDGSTHVTLSDNTRRMNMCRSLIFVFYIVAVGGCAIAISILIGLRDSQDIRQQEAEYLTRTN